VLLFVATKTASLAVAIDCLAEAVLVNRLTGCEEMVAAVDQPLQQQQTIQPTLKTRCSLFFF
jgi:hypothetical protein